MPKPANNLDGFSCDSDSFSPYLLVDSFHQVLWLKHFSDYSIFLKWKNDFILRLGVLTIQLFQEVLSVLFSLDTRFHFFPKATATILSFKVSIDKFFPENSTQKHSLTFAESKSFSEVAQIHISRISNSYFSSTTNWIVFIKVWIDKLILWQVFLIEKLLIFFLSWRFDCSSLP